MLNNSLPIKEAVKHARQCQQHGQYAEAESICQQILAQAPHSFEALVVYCTCLIHKGAMPQAIEYYKHFIQKQPHHTGALTNLGNLWQQQNNRIEAEKCFRSALAIEPNFTGALNNLAGLLIKHGNAKEALKLYCRALKTAPSDPKLNSNYLFTLQYLPKQDPQELYKCHLQWQKNVCPHIQPMDHSKHNKTLHRPLRVGYISPDFRTHPVAYFFGGILSNHNREQVIPYCYANVHTPDGLTEQLKKFAYQWHNIVGMGSEAIAQCIYKDNIDILVDLAGHTANNNLEALAYKPAPIQVTYLGYPNTTGLSTIDYRFTDTIADSPGMDDNYYVEKNIHLPHGMLNYRPAANSPAPTIPPAVKNGFITFGCFNNLTKVSEETLETWFAILHRLPTARMIIKYRSFKDTETCHYFLTLFKKAGIAKERIEFHPNTPCYIDHLAMYNEMDIMLDTYPYNGVTTTCESLWMATPVITRYGKTHASHMGASILHRVDLDDFVTYTPEEAANIAARYSNNIPALKHLCDNLRQRMKASSLLKSQQMATDVETAYRTFWKKYVNT